MVSGSTDEEEGIDASEPLLLDRDYGGLSRRRNNNRQLSIYDLAALPPDYPLFPMGWKATIRCTVVVGTIVLVVTTVLFAVISFFDSVNSG